MTANALLVPGLHRLIAGFAAIALITGALGCAPRSKNEGRAQAAQAGLLERPKVEHTVSVVVRDNLGRVIQSTGEQLAPAPDAAAAATAPPPVSLRRRENFLARWWKAIFPPKPRPAHAAPPVWVGRIALIDEPGRFVLVDGTNLFSLTPGDLLTCVGEAEETGTVRVTPDRKHPFFIADIVAGKPRVGDRVYSPKL